MLLLYPGGCRGWMTRFHHHWRRWRWWMKMMVMIMMVVVPVVRWGDAAAATTAQRLVLVIVVVAGGKVGPTSFSSWFQHARMRMMMWVVVWPTIAIAIASSSHGLIAEHAATAAAPIRWERWRMVMMFVSVHHAVLRRHFSRYSFVFSRPISIG